MATLGTNANTSLTAFTWSQAPAVLSEANLTTLKAGILDDVSPGSKQVFVDRSRGTILIPRRGGLIIFPGDVLAFDPATGFPIVVSAAAIASGSSQWHYV